MARRDDLDYEWLMREVAQSMETSKLSRRSSRTSFGQTSKRHSARIEKPRSTHPSPRSPERRRTAKSTRYYSSLDDHYRRMMGLDDDDEELNNGNTQAITRPVSWHPSSSSHQYSPLGHESLCSVDLSPRSNYASIQSSPFYHQYQLPVVEPTWSQYMHGQVTATSISPSYATVSNMSAAWAHTNPIEDEGIVPLDTTDSNDHDTLKQDDREQSVELVGLGLYDQPGTTVKIGSKLEEECEPPEAMEAADPDDESSEEEEEELPKPEDAQIAQTSLPMMNMSGQSFFFDDDERVKSTWWPEQRKQPEPQVRSMNSYGWL